MLARCGCGESVCCGDGLAQGAKDWPKLVWIRDARAEAKPVTISTRPLPPLKTFAKRGEPLRRPQPARERPGAGLDLGERGGERLAKFPNDTIGGNVLRALGLPPDRVQSALDIVKDNGRYAGIIRETPTGPFVNLDSPGVPAPTATPALLEHDVDEEPVAGAKALPGTAPSAQGGSPSALQVSPAPATPSFDPKINRVFISHGKQRAVAAQIKELLAFGNFEPVVSIERESTAIPVPEKVFEDMRSCGAGVIHVGGEGKYLDREGAEHSKINDNVLIEIGAAMALYGKKVVLLVEKGVTLPSNLQGLYRCDFEGDRLDYEATMKLLKTFSQFR